MNTETRHLAFAALLASLALLLPSPTAAQTDWETVEIATQPVRGGVHVLFGRGGNVAVSTGADGVMVVDDQYAPLTPKILAAIAELGTGPVRFVVNTHWHGDHTGGNEALGETGAIVVAHENVRRRMSTEQWNELWDRRTPPSPEGALPVVTFTDATTFHWNDDEIHVFHVPPAHTDGDSIVHFRTADVIHAGDLVWNGNYPFVDLWSGGDYDGVIAATERILELAGAETRIIPGHGAIATRSEVEAYLAMLRGVREAVAGHVAADRTLAQTIAAKPTAPWDETWGGGFIDPETMTKIVYWSLTGGVDTALRPVAEGAVKGWELYSWPEPDGTWRFALLEGTNRLKTWEELLLAATTGAELRERLAELAPGEAVGWCHERLEDLATPLAYPPTETAAALVAAAREHDVRLDRCTG